MWDNPADAFKELDSKEHVPFAQNLGAYLKALLDEGFTREEAVKLVKLEARFWYEVSMEDYINDRSEEEDEEDEDSTVDPGEEV